MAKITRIDWTEDQPVIRNARDRILASDLVQSLVDLLDEHDLNAIEARKYLVKGGVLYYVTVGKNRRDSKYYVSMKGPSRLTSGGVLTDAFGEIYFGDDSET